MMNGDLICTLLAVLNWRVTVEEQILRGEGQIKISGSPALKKNKNKNPAWRFSQSSGTKSKD